MKVAMTTAVIKLLAAVVCLAVTVDVAAQDALSIVTPCVSLSASDRQKLSQGGLVSRTLPSHRGQVAVFAATSIAATGDTLADATRQIADLKKSSFVKAIRRFSDPPQLSDLDELMPDERDIAAMMQCEVGACSFKLTAAEIAALKAHRGDRQAVVGAYRRVILDRVTTYLSGGVAGIAPIVNRSKPKQPSAILAALQAESPCITQRPPLDAWLRDEPVRDVESFLYWSYETYGGGKPVVLVTHVAILRESPDTTIVVGKQILGTRYVDGALAMTAITAGRDGTRYLFYLNRTSVDLLDGFFGPIKRNLLESRLSSELPEIIQKLRARLERNTHDTRSHSLRHD